MRPNRIKSKKNINRKIPKKKYLRKNKIFWGSTSVQNADLESINMVLYKNVSNYLLLSISNLICFIENT